jgi:hypothetical protein
VTHKGNAMRTFRTQQVCVHESSPFTVLCSYIDCKKFEHTLTLNGSGKLVIRLVLGAKFGMAIPMKYYVNKSDGSTSASFGLNIGLSFTLNSGRLPGWNDE